MNKSFFVAAATACVFVLAAPVQAETPRVQHFQGQSADTLEAAVRNFSEYNKRLEKVLAGTLKDQDIHDVHELTYTLETALEKIHTDLKALADTLEDLHKASERMNPQEVKKHGQAYLAVARKVIK